MSQSNKLRFFAFSWIVCSMIMVFSSKSLGENTLRISDGHTFSESFSVEANASLQTSKQKVITGKVKDSQSGDLIIGARVIEKGTSNGVLTDIDGNFKLTVPENASISIIYVGYLSQDILVKDQTAFEIALVQDVQMLEDIVVVGFGKQKRVSVVGAVEAIKPSTLKTSSSSFTTSFAGKIAGMISVQKSGEPGADGASFWIRGISTFGTTNPLIILDGVEVPSSILNSLPPETIEQFSVLKDATATALYGTRGANGVLLITTKSGKNLERMNVNIRAQAGFSTHTRKMELADGITYMNMYNEAIAARLPEGGNYTPKFNQEKIDGTVNQLNPYVYPNVNWYDLMFKDNTYNQNINLNITGGGKRVNYFLNASIFNETGLLRDPQENQFKDNVNIRNLQYVLQSNVSATVTPTTTIGVKLNALFKDRQGPKESTQYLYFLTMNATPSVFPATFPSQADKDYILFGNAMGPNSGIYRNPYAQMVSGYNRTNASQIFGVFDFDQKLDFITEGLTFKSLISFNNYAATSVVRSFIPHYFSLTSHTQDPDGEYQYELSPIGPVGATYLSTSTSSSGDRRVNLQASFDYSRTFNDVHDVNAMAVYYQSQFDNNTPTSELLATLPRRTQGLAGRLTYGYDERYLLEANFGYNGSENFKKGKRFGFFPSVAAGYVISNESYFKSLLPYINILKLRGSYGLVGNDQMGARFPYISNVNLNSNGYTFGYDFNNTLSGVQILLLGNEEASWEIGRKIDLGIEIGLFKDLTIIADVFKEIRTGIFMQRRTIPSTGGFANMLPYGNLGKVENKGFDMSIEYNKAINKDFLLSFRANFTYAANKLLDKDEPKPQWAYLSEIGEPLNCYRGLIAEKLFESEEEILNSPVQTFQADVRPGDIKYKDLNNDNRIDANDMKRIGSPEVPQIVYGFGPSIQYKNLDFSFFFQGTGKVSLLMTGMHPMGFNEANFAKYIVDDYWSVNNPNPNASYPRLDYQANLNNNQTSTYWLKDASFLRLKNLEIGYTYKYLRLYMSGTNLLTFSKFKFWDPEQGSGSGFQYPLQKTAQVGLQFTF